MHPGRAAEYLDNFVLPVPGIARAPDLNHLPEKKLPVHKQIFPGLSYKFDRTRPVGLALMSLTLLCYDNRNKPSWSRKNGHNKP